MSIGPDGGSQQLRLYRIARRDGSDREQACEESGIGLEEAKLIDANDAKHPPGPQCFVLLASSSPTEGQFMPKHDTMEDQPEADDPLVELAGETLRGDIRDSLLAWFKAQPKAWPFMAEREQRDLADAADRYAKTVITSACKIIAAGERPCIVATLVEYKEKDGVEAKLKLPSKGEVVAALHEACGREVLVVTSGAEEYLGEAGPAEIDADQPKFPDIGEEYAEAA